MKLYKLYEQVLAEGTTAKKLYHGTHIKNLEDIKKYGLLPEFGDMVKSTEAWEYYMDDEYTNPDDRFDGVLFFSDNPNTWSYSHFGGTPNIDEAVLVVIENNETIFRKVGYKIYDSEGNIDVSPDYYDADKLPGFIEDGDYFSFQEQEPIDILYGDRLKKFLKL
jgi:hypothetical protein